MNVSLNEEIVSEFTFNYTIFALSFITIIVDLVLIFVIKRVQKKFVNVEFYILITLIINFIFIKIVNIIITIFLSKTIVRSKIFCLLSYSFLWTSTIQYFFILFYYSLYHLSSLGTTKFFLKLKTLIKKTNYFLIYNLTTLIFLFVYTFSFCFILQNDIFYSEYQHCDLQSKWKNYETLNLFYIVLAHVFPSILTINVYSISSCLIIKRIFIKKLNYSLHELRHYSKMLKVLIKFFLLNILSNTNILYLILISINYILKAIYLKLIIHYLSVFAIYAVFFHALILVVVHNRLKKELVLNLKNVFSYLKRKMNQ